MSDLRPMYFVRSPDGPWHSVMPRSPGQWELLTACGVESTLFVETATDLAPYDKRCNVCESELSTKVRAGSIDGE